MSINQICNDPDEEVKEAAAVLENMKQTSTRSSLEVTNTSTHEGSVANPNGEGFMSRLGDLPFVRRTMNAYEQVSAPATTTTTTTTTTPTTVTRSRWQQMLVGAGAAAGAAGAVVSEESMKSLQYCLQWLNYATQHIDHQIAVLRDFIVKLTTPSSGGALIPSPASTLASIKREVVDTLRKVIEVVSKYASSCLPDQAKRNVRSFILNLPTRWASINHNDPSPSPRSSPQLGPTPNPNHQTADYARRLLSLASESLVMLKSVGDIFGETVDRAEAWIERLRMIGVKGNTVDHSAQYNNQPIGWSSSTSPQQQNGTTLNGYASSYGQTTPHSTTGSRSRRSSSSSRMNGHGPRKHSRLPFSNDDDEDFGSNAYDSDSSTDSEIEEDKRMEDNNRLHRPLKSTNGTKSSVPHGGLNSARKRKKAAKEENDRMDLS